MTTPDRPLRMELAFEVPGTPDQVWEAVATANGISSWFLPTDVEEREGGAICFHMGDTDSPGTITGWDPPRRFACVEPSWAELAGQDPSSVTPLATEFLVEAQDGGTCIVRVVSSAFGTGADWEQEFFDEMEKGWSPFFEHLRLYLTHFPGQRVTSLSVWVDLPGAPEEIGSAMRRELGVDRAGQPFAIGELAGHVERAGPADLLVRLTGRVPGLLAMYAFDKGDGMTTVQLQGYLFSDEAPNLVEREREMWERWLQALVPAASPADHR